MDPSLEDLHAEREACCDSVNALKVARAWAFEHSPASSDPVDETYLAKVDECDIFILILGRELSDPVENEYARAYSMSKPRLVFVKDVSDRSERAGQWLAERRDVKWRPFEAGKDLGGNVEAAVIDELVKSHRRLHLTSKDLEQIATQLRSEPVS